MGKGQDKIAISLMDLQPTAIVEFFLLYFNTIDRPDSFLAFHGGSNFNKGIVWQGITYLPVPVETEGFEINANGQMPRPKIRISNKDYFITDMLIRNSDFQYSDVIRKRTFIKYLDDVNFDGGNPWGEADASAEISNESYVISQKIAENKNYVEFELTSPLDLDNFELNNRLILSRYCCWTYRGNGCNYMGRAIETEEGEVLMPNTPTEGSTNQEWSATKDYSVNDSVFLLNKRIITDIIINNSSSTTKYAEIWFVCKQDHNSSEKTKPEDNSSYWLKDGCTKKLSACRKRFSTTSSRLVRDVNKSITNNYIDFSFKNINPTNNIAYDSTGISASSTYTGIEQAGGTLSINYAVDNLLDSYWLGGDADASGIVYFKDLPSSTISRINLFDAPGTVNNFGTGIFSISGSAVYNQTLVVSPDGSQSSLIPTSPYTAVTGLKISASNGANLRGLSQIDLIDDTFNYGLYNTGFISEKIHLGAGFLIGMWGQLASGAVSNIKLNLLHTVKPNCQFSGLNLYLLDSNLYCDFAVTSQLKDIVTVTPQTIGPMQYQGIAQGDKFCIFIENYQFDGNSTGQQNSKLIIYDINKNIIGQYIPEVSDTGNNYSGESFLFKDPAKQQGISNLYFGINQWEDYSRGIVYTTPMKFGTVAIWGTSLIDNDIRQDAFISNVDVISNSLFPINYNQIDSASSVLDNLYAWWDMDIQTNVDIGPGNGVDQSAYRSLSNVIINIDNPISTFQHEYEVSGFDGSPYLFLTGKYQSNIETTQTQQTLQYKTENIAPVAGLPFGGFPGTDKYGR